ncbi:MAG: MmcQ/YjbR family DNA-binding protein [Spirochaetales bacterium]|nr:MmcQ/YjbR family DNA-binding protein [Spirochaetales bacterium]
MDNALEASVFKYKRFVPSLMEKYGFSRIDGHYVYETLFMNGAFKAKLTVFEDGSFFGEVVDMMNEEIYAHLRMETFDGPYVNSVRTAYIEVLSDIASKCCTDVLFYSDQANRITAWILKRYGVRPDFPWDEKPHKSSGVFRHTDSRKWFGLIMNLRLGQLLKNKDSTSVDVMNLKIDPYDGESLRTVPGIFEAYHMNHKSWISVVLNDTLDDRSVMILIESSFNLTSRTA